MSNYYSQDPPPNVRQGSPRQQPYGYGQQQDPYQQQQQYGPPVPYGANYGEEQRYGSPYNNGPYPPPQRYDQPYDQPYDQQRYDEGDERGLFGGSSQQGPGGKQHHYGAMAAGAAGGAFLGHELKGGPVADIGGALLGAFIANKFEKHQDKKHAERDAQKMYANGYGPGPQGGLGGSRDIDGYEDERYEDEEYREDYDRPRRRRHSRDYDDRDDRYYQQDSYRRDSGSFRQEDFYDRRY